MEKKQTIIVRNIIFLYRILLIQVTHPGKQVQRWEFRNERLKKKKKKTRIRSRKN